MTVRGAGAAAATVWLLAAGAGAACRTAEPADLVIRNARVYTVEPGRPWAEALAVRGERIVWVGADREADQHVSSATRVIDAGGRLLLPGFIDSHNHIKMGSDPDIVSLFGTRSLGEIQERIRVFARRHPDLAWIEGEGWNYSVFPGGRLPTAADLETLTGGRPAFLTAYDYHTAWLNREALRDFGITRATRRVSFAEKIERDPRTGQPTGILTSIASAGLATGVEDDLDRKLPSHSPERRYRNFRGSLATAARFGITTIVEPQSSLADLPMYVKARDAGDLKSRLQIALFHPRGLPETELARFEEARRRFDDDRIRVSAVKLYIDDVIEPHTAAMLAPYADRPGESGHTLWPPEEFDAVVARLDAMKFQIFIHAIGDRGIRTALDALERARRADGPRDSRHQLVHIECLSPEDIPRFQALGVVACMQPRHCAPDISGAWAAAVGPERSRYAWAFRSLRDSGAVLAFGSDWNVAEMDPLVGIYTALTREGIDGKPEGGWIPEQTIDLETAIRGYTIQAAWANFVEQNRGSIAPGKYADAVLLSGNLFQIPPEKLKDVRVVLTLVGGQEIYTAL